MRAMEYYSTLLCASVVIGALALVLYRRCRDWGVLVGIGALYYWSLYGAWWIVIDKSGGFSGQHYHYLEYKLFPIALDQDYLISIALYAAFVIVVELTMLCALSRRPARTPQPIVLRHEWVLLTGFLAAVASFLLVRDKLSSAWALNTSAYLYTRSQTGDWFTLHQVLNRVALIPPAIGVATLAAGRSSRFFINVTRRYTLAAYLALIGAMSVFTFILGNKNELFTALLAGMLTYVGSVRRPRWLVLGVCLAGGLWLLGAIDFFRGTPVSGMGEAIEARLEESTGVAQFLASSNEAFAAHFSLYGVLSARTQPQFGYSLYSLACSIVPRVLWPTRPRDIYFYYSESVGAIQNQGYSLHHATGWYLNFGYAGVVLGAMILGLLWAGCMNLHRRTRRDRKLAMRIFAVIAPWVFVAGIPALLRAGPEGYKGMLIECVLIPAGVLTLACRPKRVNRKRILLPAQNRWEPAPAP
jgi:hypothetical protein